jgi:hypothetical protein
MWKLFALDPVCKECVHSCPHRQIFAKAVLRNRAKTRGIAINMLIFPWNLIVFIAPVALISFDRRKKAVWAIWGNIWP